MHKAKILYASETGNGEEITRMLEEECVYGSIPAERFCFSQIGTDFSLNPPEVCVIVVSSTGDGEMPSNGIPLLRWLRTEQPNLTGIRFAMLGLGDSNYSTYMGNPRNLYTIFKNLGAEEFIPLTEADEQCGMEDVVEPWMAKVQELIPQELAKIKDIQKQAQSKIQVDTGIIEAQVEGLQLLTQVDAVKEVWEIRVRGEFGNYEPGAALQVLPLNDKEVCRQVLEKFNLVGEVTDWQQVNKGLVGRVNLPLSVQDYFENCVDLTFPVKRSTLEHIESYLADQSEKETLRQIQDNLPSLKTLSETFHSWRLDQTALQYLPILATRSYSINTLPEVSPNSIAIAFTLEGVCTNYMRRLSEGQRIRLILPDNKSEFYTSFENSQKILIISNGSGISPFKPLIEKFSASKQIYLIHGCRYIDNSQEDFIYRNQITQLVSKLKIVTSRQDQKYVQDALDIQEITEFNPDAVLLCGNFPYEQIKTLLPNFKIIAEEWE